MVLFGHAVTVWVAPSISPDVRKSIYAIAVLVRWSVSLGASVGLTALIYHLGVPARYLGDASKREWRGMGQGGILMPQAWIPTLPGAVVATAMWFFTTLAFGWYVTR